MHAIYLNNGTELKPIGIMTNEAEAIDILCKIAKAERT